ncbi:hypothetical protein BRADI_5g03174v3 [Brachypodium distachyon]|uniref:Uncharacterized protein n=1 Tax=Brachypodium distachyon TaxID=15368 RepID=A0A0Q3I6Z0_BRADI|nr:hypothetical protein BRADI_5g03174v3 [Brachypodium distachyon]
MGSARLMVAASCQRPTAAPYAACTSGEPLPVMCIYAM